MASLDIRSLYPEELNELVVSLGEKPFRARQLFSWLHEKQAVSYDEMTNLPAAFREKLGREQPLTTLRCIRTQTSAIDGTQKKLFALNDGNVIESVLMRYHHGNTVCVSSQVGCRMNCSFCASGVDGLVRNLLPSEMLEQVYRIQKETGERVSNIVIMGSGEPLDNYENVMRFIRLAVHEEGLNLSQRNITLSTCGLVPGILKLAEEKLAVTLAVSLHAPNDEKRRKLMPVAKRYSIAEILDACRAYFEKTGRRVSFEYALVAGENDSEEDAAQLARLMRKIHGHVNLIPVNPVKEHKYRRPDKKVGLYFQNNLEKYGINVTIRRELGSDIDGACGQLRRSYLERNGR